MSTEWAKRNHARLLELKAAYRSRNRQKICEYAKEYRRNNQGKVRGIEAAARLNRTEKRKEYDAKYYQDNRQERIVVALAWQKENPDKHAATNAKRRAAELNQCPPWADLDEIRKIYAVAKESGLTVDHVIPLRGKKVSGLHVHTNLQLLTLSANSAKGNRF